MQTRPWYLKQDADEIGPLTEIELAAMLATRSVTRDAQVRADGAQAPQSLADTFAFARDTPPPLPSPEARIRDAPATGPWTDRKPRAWRRYLARMLDLSLFGFLSWIQIGLLLGAANPQRAETLLTSFEGRLGAIVDSLLSIPLGMFWCAIFIGLTGCSPGKWLMGIRIVDKAGNPPGLFNAFEREATIWITGLGLGLPLVSLMTLLTSYNHLEKRGSTWWDERQGLTALHRPAGRLQVLFMVFGVALWIIAVVVARFLR